MTEFVKKAEYAERKGWARSTVTRMAQAGRIVLTADGLVDVEASEMQLAKTADPSKDGVVKRHAKARTHQAVGQYAAAAAPDLPSAPKTTKRRDPSEESGGNEYQENRAAREGWLAKLAEMEAKKMAGELLDRDAVLAAINDVMLHLAQLLDNLAPSLAPQLTDNPARNYDLIEKQVEDMRNEVSDKLEKLAAGQLDLET